MLQCNIDLAGTEAFAPSGECVTARRIRQVHADFPVATQHMACKISFYCK